MYLNYAKLELNENGIPETPVLMLKTLSNETIGIIPGVFNLKMNIKFSEPSEISFDIPAILDGEKNWIYDELTGYKVIYTEHYGVYMTMNPTTDSDGVAEIKHIKGYSIEKLLDSKKFFLEEGTFKFYDSTNPYNTNTLFGRILEIAVGWKAGYISPTIAQRYRTFSQYDDFLLSFIYNTAPEKYRCVFVFEPYEKTINVYDADEERTNLPIYLDFDNLLESVDVEELSDELVTAIRPYGADGLDIREVNPIGTGWIYDVSHFIANGDIPKFLADKYESWQRRILNNRSYFEGLSALRASVTARLLSAKAELTELQGELEILISQQSVTIQALANETTAQGKQSQQAVLNDINSKISAKKREISNQMSVIADIESELDENNSSSCVAKINNIVEQLSITNYFSEEEYSVLSNYLIEQDVTEDTFVATDIDTAVSGNSYPLSNQSVNISGSTITKIDLTSDFSKTMYSLAGGSFVFSGSAPVSGDIIRGTLEVSSGNKFVLSIYAGSLRVNNTSASSGMITMDGTLRNFSSNISVRNEDGISTYKGSTMQFNTSSGTMYLTANINDYKRYSVKMELYEYGVGVLADLATPTYEFSVESGNFLFANEFAPFRNKLELGKGVYVNIGGKQTITPYIIEFELDFENKESFSIVFSNRFKRHDAVNTLSDMIESSYSSSRSFDASKYIYNQTANQATQVSDFMQSSLDAAVNTIIAASNQSVIINGAGIHVGGDSPYQIRIVDSMIAMSDDNWATAKLALGLFKTESTGTYFGVNAEVIGGKLIVGNNLVIENATDDGVMQFMVDASGAWLNNATFVLQNQTGGNIIIDPDYGVVAGNNSLFTTEGTTVTPSFIDSDGDIVTDTDGMPKNANFFLDIRDGSAYFRGEVMATSGKIGGFTIAQDYLYAGSGSNYVALNGSGGNNNSLYAIWAGASSPSSAPFKVKKDGTVIAKNGEFTQCKVAGATFQDMRGNSMMNNGYQFKADYLNLNGINVGNGNFVVDSAGNVSVKGSISMGTGSSINWATVSEMNLSSSSSYQKATNAYNLADSALDTANDAYDIGSSANTTARELRSDVKAIVNGEYTGGSFISGDTIYSPTLVGAEIYWGQGGTYGSLTRGYGSDGAYRTNIVELYSNQGIVLTATTNMRIDALTLNLTMEPEDVRLYYNGNWRTLYQVIQYIAQDVVTANSTS